MTTTAGTAAAPKPPQPKKSTRASKDVPELILGSKDDQFTVNQKDFELIAGQGYRWKITAAGGLEYKFHTDLFRNVWINQIVINDLEVHMNGAPAWLEFDADGTIQVQFTDRPPRQLHLVGAGPRGQGHEGHDHGQVGSPRATGLPGRTDARTCRYGKERIGGSVRTGMETDGVAALDVAGVSHSYGAKTGARRRVLLDSRRRPSPSCSASTAPARRRCSR